MSNEPDEGSVPNKNRLNRIFGGGKFIFEHEIAKCRDTFKHVEFEKYDPRVTQRTVRLSDMGDLDNLELDDSMDFDSDDSQKSENIVVSHDNQMTRTLNMWVGNCNIDVTHPMSSDIEKIAGVETLEVLSRYRFRIGIGKLFDDNAVKSMVADVIKLKDPTKKPK